jgi:hypothetical protein
LWIGTYALLLGSAIEAVREDVTEPDTSPEQ